MVRAVTEFSQAVEQRQSSFAAEIANSSKLVGAIHEILKDEVTVPMRRLLRERTSTPKTWTKAFADRPRAPMERMPDTMIRIVAKNYADALTWD